MLEETETALSVLTIHFRVGILTGDYKKRAKMSIPDLKKITFLEDN